jgi:hypothetical protein
MKYDSKNRQLSFIDLPTEVQLDFLIQNQEDPEFDTGQFYFELVTIE